MRRCKEHWRKRRRSFWELLVKFLDISWFHVVSLFPSLLAGNRWIFWSLGSFRKDLFIVFRRRSFENQGVCLEGSIVKMCFGSSCFCGGWGVGMCSRLNEFCGENALFLSALLECFWKDLLDCTEVQLFDARFWWTMMNLLLLQFLIRFISAFFHGPTTSTSSACRRNPRPHPVCLRFKDLVVLEDEVDSPEQQATKMRS